MAMKEKELVGPNKVVELNYTLRFDDGQIGETTEGETPMPYLFGTGALPQRLEEALAGRTVGDSFSLTLAPEEAYGPYDEEAVDEIPLDAFPEGTELTEGEEIFFFSDEGDEMAGIIESVNRDRVVVNYNHPYAGETVTFNVEIVGLRDATDEEIEHGHAHDPYTVMQEDFDDDEDWDDDEEWDDEDWDDDEEWDDDEDWDDDEEWDEEE